MPQLVELYQTNVGASSGAEGISKDFIDTSLTMYERVLCIPNVSKLMQEADCDKKNPFDGSTKIQTIVGKCGSRENIS